MVAEFRSHVLLRDEKGFAGVPFKRLLLAGVGGGLVYTLIKIILPDWSLVLAIVSCGLLVFLTATPSGLPRWQRIQYGVRGNLMLATIRYPSGIMAKTAKLLEISAAQTTLDSQTLFVPPAVLDQIDVTEWVTFAQAIDADHDDGLRFVERHAEVR